MHNRFASIFALVFVSMLALTAAAAQDTVLPRLYADSPQIITLPESAEINFAYTADAPMLITVTARSLAEPGVLDLVLEAYDNQGRLLGLSDDHDLLDPSLSDTDSLIPNLYLTRAGDYRILLRTFARRGTGKVELSLTTAAPPMNEAELAVTTSGIERRILSVPPNEVLDYNVNAYAGQRVTLVARALTENFDPALDFFGPDMNLISTNDDHGRPDSALGTRDAQIAPIDISVSAAYTARVRGIGGSSGDVELIITREISPLLNLPVPLRADIVVEGLLETGHTYEQMLVVEAGDLMSISVTSDSVMLDPRVALLDANKRVIETGERVEVDSNLPARIERFIMPQGGVYLVEVRGYLDSSGEFTLTIRHLARDAPLGDPAVTTTRGEVLVDGHYTQALTVRAGEYVTITARALTSNFDPRVTLRTGDGEPLAMNDDHGSSEPTLSLLDARIPNYPIPVNGTYIIDVDSYDGGAGAFEVVVERRVGESTD